MAFVSGARDVQHDQDDHIVDLEKSLKFLNPRRSIGFLKLLKLGSESVASWKHEWAQTSLGTRKETVTLADGSGTSLTVADAYQYTVDDTILIESELVRVTAIAGATTLTIARAQAGTTGAAHAAKTATKLGTAREENSTANPSVTDTADRLYNYIQTFDKTVELSTHEMAQIALEDNPFQGQLQRRMIETMRDLSAAFWYGKRSADTSGKRYYAGGMKTFVTTNVSNVAGAVTVDAIDDVIESIVNAGGDPTHIVLHPTQKRKLDLLDASLVRMGKRDKVGGNPDVRTWQSGVLENDLQLVTDLSLEASELWIVDKNMVKIPKLRAPGHGFRYIPATAPGQDGKKSRILGHYTFKIEQEKSHGYLYGLTT